MQSITALAHLKACILFFIDLSSTCGYTIAHQVTLYQNVKPLFKNKPILIVLTKSDLKKFEELDEEDQKLLNQVKAEENVQMVEMSNKNKEGVSDVKAEACEILLKFRLE